MTATDTDDGNTEKRTVTDREIDNLRAAGEKLRSDFNDLADALESGDADVKDVTSTIAALSFAYVDIEDAAHSAGVIDSGADEWRAVNQAREVLCHAPHAISLRGRDDVISPTPAGRWSGAIESAASSAEYAELARDASDDDE